MGMLVIFVTNIDCQISQLLQNHRKLLFHKMDIENIQFKLFTTLDSQQINQFLQQAPTLVGAFSLQQEQEPDLCLSLFKNILLLKDKYKNYHYLKLEFEIKLEILYQRNKDVTSEIIGINLYSESNQNICLYGSDSSQFAQILGKILNMKGFHEMFRPIKKLGRGNFATVYQAERATDKQRFAVKAFSKQNSYCAKNGKESLMNELSLLRSLNIEPHPNVLRLQAVYQSQNSIYVVLELLQGQTLLQTIQNRVDELLSPKQIKIIMQGILKGINHLVKNRVMHRDIKPENIMIRKNTMEPVIVDFGLATNVDLPEYLFFRCGTPGYVAPEIIMLTQSIHLEPTCDMFSLAAVFHLLLVSKPLFAGIKYDQVYKNNKQFRFSLQTDAFKKVSAQAIDLLSKMLTINAALRITPQAALQHPYFSESCQDFTRGSATTKTLDSPTNTETSVSVGQKKKKKRFFFF